MEQSAARGMGRRARVARGLATLLLAGLLVRTIARRPLTLRRPATVLSNCEWAMRSSEPFVLFLDDVRRRLPRGARVTVLEPDRSEINFMIAIGQLPDQDVLHPTILQSGDRSAWPEWLASFGAEIRDARFERSAELPGGALYRVRP